MSFRFTAPLAGILALALGAAAMAADVPASITAALADAGRPATDTSRDAARHPGELLAFAGVKPGDRVGDFIMGGGYFTRIFARTVGEGGKVYAYQPKEFIQFNGQYQKSLDAVAAAYPNVTPLNNSLGAVAFPEPLDVIFTAQNYHDLHLGFIPAPALAAIDKAIFNSLKPGGVLIVVDHAAIDGTGDTRSKALHRIDIATVKAEMTAAGFVLDGESEILRNPADPRTASVFDPVIKGQTDQFVLKFRKPA